MEAYFKKLYQGSRESLFEEIRSSLENQQKEFIVTANPETFMIGDQNPDFHNLLMKEDTKIIPDGIGLVKGADLVFVALGIPRQELLIDRYFPLAKKGIFVGVGGSFDVLSGMKQRAPQVFIDHNLEWLYRIVKEPKRMKRFYRSNIKFIWKIQKLKRGAKRGG